MIGKMDRRITIQGKTVARTKGVKTSDGWATLETVYGSLEPLSGFERRTAEQNGQFITHKVLMRYRDDLGDSNVELSPQHQLVIDGVTYEVRSVLNRELRGKWYDVRVEEKA